LRSESRRPGGASIRNASAKYERNDPARLKIVKALTNFRPLQIETRAGRDEKSSLVPSVYMRARSMLVFAVLLAACTTEGATEPSEPLAPAVVRPTPPEPTTYTYSDVAPILARRCQGCHVPGGAGPFPLTTFDEAKAQHRAIASAVVARSMPPWLPAEGCQTFTDSRHLTDAEIDVLRSWSDGGAPLGAPVPPMAPPAARKLAWVDAVLDIGADYVAQPAQGPGDDWRCFLLDPKLTEDKVVIGYDLEPTDRASVHHAAFVDAPIDSAREADDASPGAGWPCPGGVGVPAFRVIGSWAAGYNATEYPAGIGMTVPKGRGLVAQIHYHQHDPSRPPIPDRTRISLQYARTSVKEADYLAMAVGQIVLPPRSTGTTLETSYAIANDTMLRGMVGHMHLFGRKLQVEVIPPAGGSSCLMDIPQWNYRWEEMLFLERPVLLAAGSTVKLTCTWDNPSDHVVESGLTLEGEMCDLGFVVTGR
jgi:hypothetical protein